MGKCIIFFIYTQMGIRSMPRLWDHCLKYAKHCIMIACDAHTHSHTSFCFILVDKYGLQLYYLPIQYKDILFFFATILQDYTKMIQDLLFIVKLGIVDLVQKAG